MSSRSENIRFNVYLNDRQAGNTMGQLYKQSRVLRSELNKLKIGSQAWISKMKELQKVEKNLQKVRAEVRNTNSFMSRMANKFNKYFGVVTAGIAGITAAVYTLRESMNVMVEFEKTMANVLTLLSDADKQKFGDFLKKGSIQIIKEYGFSIQDTNKALFDSISAGVEAGESIDFLNEASVLAIGGVTELSTSVDGLTTIINAYKLDTRDATDVAAAFFSAQKEGKTTVAELSSGIGKAAPLANSLGISYQELMSATAALTKGGIKTDEAFTYLRGTFTNLIKPTSDLNKMFLSEFGHAINASEVKARGFETILSELSILLEKYPNELQGSIENVRALTAVTALSGKGLDEYRDILEKVNTDIGENSSLNKAFAEQEQTLSQHMEEAKGNIVAMTISLVEGFRPAIIAITSKVSQFSHALLNFGVWMQENSEKVKLFAKALGVVLTSIATYKAVVMASNAKVNIMIRLTGMMQAVALRASIAYNKLTGNITRAAAAQRVLNTTTKANPLGLIVGLLATAAAAYLAFRDKVNEATAAQKKYNKALQEGKELLEGTKTLEERAKLLDNMSKTQLEKFKSDAENQMRLISEHDEKMKLARQEYLKEQNELIKMNGQEIGWYEKQEQEERVAAAKKHWMSMIDITRDAKEQELQTYVDSADAKLKLIDDEENPNPTGSGNYMTDAEIKKLEALNNKISELERSRELEGMEKKQREVEQVRDKYAKLIADAEGHDAQIRRLEELRDADIRQLQAEQNQSYIDKRAEIQQQIKEIGYTDREEELAANQQTFDDLIAMAEIYGLDTAALLEQQKINEQTIKEKYNKQEIAANAKKNEAMKRANYSATMATLSVMGQSVGAMQGLMNQQSEEFKALAYFQTAINTAAAAMSAYNSVVGTPYVGPILAPIAAAAAIAAGVAQMAAIKSESYGTYAKGGVAQGASHDQGGIHMIDSQTGKKVGEMEGGEPYMILSKETYKNNHELVDALLESSVNNNGERVDWMQPGYYPHPDVQGVSANLQTVKYANGTVTNVNNLYQQQAGTPPTSNADIVVLLTQIRDGINGLKYLKAILDLDGTIELKEALADMETLENNAGL